MSEIVSIRLKPQWNGRAVDAMKCRVNFEAEIDKGKSIATMIRHAASIPGCEPQGLRVFDRLGEVHTVYEDFHGHVPHLKKGRWLTCRNVRGKVDISYTVSTRVLPAGYAASPYFDFRDEPGGASGAGWTFLILPEGNEKKVWDFTLVWDLSDLPDGASAITTFGSGTSVTVSATADTLAFSYYAVGELNCWKDRTYPQFGFYWFGKPKYNVAEIAEYTKNLYQYMSAFFGEPGKPYTVIARKDPFPFSGGGTALPGGFMYGYSDSMDVTVDSIQNLLSHEMVHNWPYLDGGSEESTWYHEGTAEYYSSVLPFRAGLITAEQMAAQFSKKTQANYYLNLFRDYSNDDAALLYWVDRETQRLPYGRGLVYLTNMDAWIREQSGGKHNLDDVVLELLKMQRRGELNGVSSWLEITERYAGADPRPYYEQMKRGDLLIPRDDTLMGLFEIKRKQEPLLDVGFDMAATFKGDGPYPVQGLKHNSNAAKAGLREGDVFSVRISRKEVLDREEATITLNVLRGEDTVQLTYLPHGELADVWYWDVKS